MSVEVNQSLSVVNTNASNNTAVLKYTVTCSCSGESYNNYSQTGTFFVDGVSYPKSYTLPRNTTTTVFSMQVTVSNASNRTISASYSFPTTPSGGIKTGNMSLTIPSIVSAPTITSFSLKSRTVNSLTFSFTCSKANAFYYRLGNGNWIRGNAKDVTSGTFSFTGLSPNTSYDVHFIARNWVSESAGTFVQDVRSVSYSTYDIARINSVNNFNHGDNTSINISNSSGGAISLQMKVGDVQVFNKLVVGGVNSIEFNDAQLDSIYKLYGSGNSVTATFILTTGSSYTDSKSCTITLKR